MFDIGWPELLVVALVLIVVVGPKDLPPMLRAFGRTTKKLRGMAAEFRGQFDDALREAELDDVKKTFDEARKLNPMNSIRDAVNPLKDTGNQIRSDLEKSVNAPATQPEAKVDIPDSKMKLADGPPDFAAPAKAAEPKPSAPAKKAAGAKQAAKPAAAKTAKSASAGKAAAKPAAKGGSATAQKKTAAKAPAKSAPKARKPKTGEGTA